MPRKIPPPGFMRAKDAADLLGVSTAMLTIYVKAGKLHRTELPERKYQFYYEQEVRALAAAEDAFFKAEKGQVATDAVFSPATPEDIQGIYDLAQRMFRQTTSAERRLEWLHKEPRGHYVVRRKNDGAIMAYLSVLSIKPDLLLPYMRGTLNREITADDLLPLKPGKPATVILKGIASDPAIEEELRTSYVAMLLRGVSGELERLGHSGIIIPTVYAFSSTDTGIAMCTKLGMREWEPSTDGRRITFQLNMYSSDAFLLKRYKSALQEWQRQHPEKLEVTRATPDDMEGVYEVATSLFGRTTSAADRKPLVARVPDGNYILRDTNTQQILAYIHLQPLKQDRLQAFLRGEIRGWQLTADDLDSFEPEKEVDVLVKSMGATRAFGEDRSTRYMQRLLLGTAREMAKLGQQGVIIRKLCATSETATGINLAMHAHMSQIGRISPDRYAFELDVVSSDLPLLKFYKAALAEYQQQYPKQLISMVSKATTQPTIEGLVFRKATPQDLDAEGYLAYLCFGPRARDTMPRRHAFLQHNPDMFYHLYDNGHLAASINIVPLRSESIEAFKQGKRGWLFDLAQIEQFTPGPHHLIIIDFMTAPVAAQARRTLYGTQLLHHMAKQLAQWGAQGVEILSIHACGSTPSGRDILRGAGFTELGEPIPGRVIFELDVPTSHIKLLQPYKEALQAAKDQQ